MEVLDMFRVWAKKRVDGYRSFMNTETSIYWLINSVIEVTLNLPYEIHNVYIADITKCFESIPLSGPDNLIDVVSFVMKTGYPEAKVLHPKANTQLWVRLTFDGPLVSA